MLGEERKASQHKYTLQNVMVVGLVLVIASMSLIAYGSDLSTFSPPSTGLVDLARWGPLAIDIAAVTFFYIVARFQRIVLYRAATPLAAVVAVSTLYTLNLSLNFTGYSSVDMIIPGAIPKGSNCGDPEIYLTDTPCALPIVMMTGAVLLFAAAVLYAYSTVKMVELLKHEQGTESFADITTNLAAQHRRSVQPGGMSEEDQLAMALAASRQEAAGPPPLYAQQQQRSSFHQPPAFAAGDQRRASAQYGSGGPAPVPRPASAQYAAGVQPQYAGQAPPRPLSNQFGPGSHPMFGQVPGYRESA